MQVKHHARLALADLSKDSVKAPPLLKYADGDKGIAHGAQVERLGRAAYKCLGEAYMEETPPAFAKALEMFSKAVPGLPNLGLAATRKKPKERGGKDPNGMQETCRKHELSDEASATLLKVGVPNFITRHALLVVATVPSCTTLCAAPYTSRIWYEFVPSMPCNHLHAGFAVCVLRGKLLPGSSGRSIAHAGAAALPESGTSQ